MNRTLSTQSKKSFPEINKDTVTDLAHFAFSLNHPTSRGDTTLAQKHLINTYNKRPNLSKLELCTNLSEFEYADNLIKEQYGKDSFLYDALVKESKKADKPECMKNLAVLAQQNTLNTVKNTPYLTYGEAVMFGCNIFEETLNDRGGISAQGIKKKYRKIQE